MVQKMPFRIGADASCSDGACGHVSRIIVNPVALEVTHLVVDPKHRNGPGRLVPVDLVDATTGQVRSGFAAPWPSSRRSGPPRRRRSCRTWTPPGPTIPGSPLA